MPFLWLGLPILPLLWSGLSILPFLWSLLHDYPQLVPMVHSCPRLNEYQLQPVTDDDEGSPVFWRRFVQPAGKSRTFACTSLEKKSYFEDHIQSQSVCDVIVLLIRRNRSYGASLVLKTNRAVNNPSTSGLKRLRISNCIAHALIIQLLLPLIRTLFLIDSRALL